MTKNEVKTILKGHYKTVADPNKSRYWHDLDKKLFNLLKYVEAEELGVERSGRSINRGSLFEVILNYHINEYLGRAYDLSKSNKKGDLNTARADLEKLKALGLERHIYEVKAISRLSGAHASAHGLEWYIIGDFKNNVIVLVHKSALVLDKCGKHVIGYTQGKELPAVMELLGW